MTGEGTGVPDWDSARRGQLVDNLELFVRPFWQVGVERIIVNGSFVTAKPRPGDIDVYFECESVRFHELVADLKALAPLLCWDWDREDRPVDPVTGIAKTRMWHRFRVEIFPHFTDQPQPTGIRDEYGNDLLFPSLFRRDKETSRPKGVIPIIRE